MPPEDTRAVARLPNLEIEIRHRNAPEEGAEYLAITLKARPDLEAAAAWLSPFRLLATATALNPWLAAWRATGWPVPGLWWPALGPPPRREG
jgi:hypothetical protein